MHATKTAHEGPSPFACRWIKARENTKDRCRKELWTVLFEVSRYCLFAYEAEREILSRPFLDSLYTSLVDLELVLYLMLLPNQRAPPASAL